MLRGPDAGVRDGSPEGRRSVVHSFIQSFHLLLAGCWGPRACLYRVTFLVCVTMNKPKHINDNTREW